MWRSTDRKNLEKIRRRWGRPRGESIHIPSVEAYTHANTDPVYHRLNDQTGNDIDFRELFLFTDHTTSRVGQQVLYDRLRAPLGEETPLQELHRQAGYFARETEQREKAQLLLKRLDHADVYSIPLLMGDRLFTRPDWYPLAIADTVIVGLLLLLSPFYPALLIWLMAPLAVNIVLHLKNKNNTFRYNKALPQLNRLIKVAGKLLHLGLPVGHTGVSESIDRLKGFRRKARRLSFGATQGSELEMVYYWAVEIIKALFLIELHSFFALIRELEQRQSEVRTLFRYVGSVDLALSVASLRAGGAVICIPDLQTRTTAQADTSKRLHVRDLYHPLIDGCVVNSLDIDGKGVLITGSNMSGKTTFLRTLGINSLLAQSLYTCFGKEYRAPFFRLYSSIRIDDNLLDGKSYYFEEVNIMGELIAAADAGEPNLYLLDEVFKGTNMVERISAAKAILSYLDRKGHVTVVSTHDLELSDMLKMKFDLYHFEEILQDGQLLFDHLLKAGPLRTRNAIRILGLAGYPEEIVRDAGETSGRLSDNRPTHETSGHLSDSSPSNGSPAGETPA